MKLAPKAINRSPKISAALTGGSGGLVEIIIWTLREESVIILLLITSCENNIITTLSNGYLGSCNDEERSEMRYVV